MRTALYFAACVGAGWSLSDEPLRMLLGAGCFLIVVFLLTDDTKSPR